MVRSLGPIETAPSLDLLGPQGPEFARLFTRPFLVLHRASGLYTARICLLLLFDLGWEARLRAGTTLDSLCAGLSEQARKPLAWMLPFLGMEDLLFRNGDTYTLKGEPDLDLAEIRAAVDAEAPGHGVNFDLLDGVRSRQARVCSSIWPCSPCGWLTSATRTWATSRTTCSPCWPCGSTFPKAPRYWNWAPGAAPSPSCWPGRARQRAGSPASRSTGSPMWRRPS
jgi:hypothetical protein